MEDNYGEKSKRTYSDKETARNSMGSNIFVGGTSDSTKGKDEDLLREFLSELNEKTNDINKDLDIKTAHLFSPSYISDKILNALPANLKSKVRKTVFGEFLKIHPFKVIEKIHA